ncbi:MAG: hypothetical protein JRI38_06810 [Deltaproteobacteria bacterium]|nr:hypothetical protein [Deltaproteobacteria bacterium]
MKFFYLCTGLLLCFMVAVLPCHADAEDQASDMLDLDFEIPEVERKPYTFRAELEISETVKSLDESSLLFYQKYPGGRDDTTLWETDLDLTLDGSYRIESVNFYARLKGSLYHTEEEDWQTDDLTEEAYVSLQPSPSIALDTGKKVLKWGKGYAWNPVAFFSRPKDLDDPEASMEGYFLASGDLIKSMDGPLKTIAVTPVILPVSSDINDDWGAERELVYGAKIYFFTWDTDLDVMFLIGEETRDRIGFDFSKNISSNFEIHGEAAIVFDYEKQVVDGQGELSAERYNALNFLAGIRYLTEGDTTIIFEYYRNGQGYTRGEINDYFDLIETGYLDYLDSGNMAGIGLSREQGALYYNQQTMMTDYLYLKVTHKEPFDILYFTPGITSVYNMNDHSLSITPQVTYTPITNIEFDIKATFVSGRGHTEYGEKINGSKIVASAALYF